MGIRTLEQLRAAAPEELKGVSDAQLIVEFANDSGRDPQEVARYFGMSTGSQRGDFTAGVASGVDQLQGLGYSALAGAADIVGLDTPRDFLNRRAEQQQYESYLAGKPERERVEDIGGFGDAIDWAQYQLGKQIPIMGGLIGAQFVPGLGQAASATGLTRLATLAPRGLGGGGFGSATGLAAQRAAVTQGAALGKSTLVGSTLGFGDLYQASGEDGEYNPYAALALAPLYGAAEAVVPALVGRGIRAPQQFTGNLASRVGKAAGVSALTEAGTEAFQTSLTRGIDSTASPEDAASEYLNAIVAGGVVGGSLGSIGGIKSPAKPKAKVEQNELNETDLAPKQTDEPLVSQAPTQIDTPVKDSRKPSVRPVDPAVAAVAPDNSTTTAYDVVFNDPNNVALLELRESAKAKTVAAKQQKALQTQANKLAQEIAEATPEQAPITNAKGKPYADGTIAIAQKRLDAKFATEQAERQSRLDALQARLSGSATTVQAKAKLKTLEEGLRKIRMVDGKPVVQGELTPEEMAAVRDIDADLYNTITEQETEVAPEQELALQEETDLTATNEPVDVQPAVMEQAELDVAVPQQDAAVSAEQVTDAPATPVNTKQVTKQTKATKAAAKPKESTTKAIEQEQLELGVDTLWDQDDHNDLVAEIEKINKGKGRLVEAADTDKSGGTLNADIVTTPARFGGKVTLPDGVIAGIAVMMRNPRDPASVQPRAYQKGIAAVDEDLTAEYGDRMREINSQLQSLAFLYSKLLNQGANASKPASKKQAAQGVRPIPNYRNAVNEFRTELMRVLDSGLLGETKYDSQANLQAIISSVKTRNEAKLTAGTPSNATKRILTQAQGRFEKSSKFNQLIDYNKFLDTMVSNMFTNLVNGKLTANSFPTRVTGTPTRTLESRLEVGAPQPLEEAYNARITGDIYTPAKGRTPEILHASGVERPEVLAEGQRWRRTSKQDNGLLGVIQRVASSGTGTASPYSVALAKAIRNALREAKTESGQPALPAVVFFEPDSGEKSRYEPSEGQFGTVYLSRIASQEVVLHESLHAATQWFIQQNPNDDAVVALAKDVTDIIAFADAGGIAEMTTLSQSYRDQAAEVVNILRDKVNEGNTLDAVAELVAYGPTLHSFQSVLKGISVESTNPKIKSWLAIVDKAFKSIMGVLRDLLGVPNTMASRVLENTIILLEKTTTDIAPDKFVGNRLDHSIDTRLEASIDENETYANGSYIAKKVTEASDRAKKLADRKITSRYFFDWVMWSKLFGRELPDGSFESGLFQQKMSKLAESIRENLPGTTRFISLFNANFVVAPYKQLIASFAAYKQDRGRFFMHANRFFDYFERMSPEKAQATINYLNNGNSARLDVYDDAVIIKEWADDAKATLIQLAQSLTGKDRDFFIKFNNQTQKFELSDKFSEVMLGVSSDKAISSHKIGQANIAKQISAVSEVYDDGTFNAFVGDLMQKDANGDPILDDEFYKVTMDMSSTGQSDYVVFVSKSIYEASNGDIESLSTEFGTGATVAAVDTITPYTYKGFRDGKHTFSRTKSFADAMTTKRVIEFTLAMRNTFGGLGMHYASKNFTDGIANAEFVYDSVDELNAALGITDRERMFTEDMLSNTAKAITDGGLFSGVNWKARAKGSMFVKVPETGWGSLAGKILPAEVWVAINDMSDRNPIVSVNLYNKGLVAWKSSKTVWNIGTQFTNVFSNVVLMMFHGIPLRTALDAAKLLVKYERAPMSLTKEERMLVVAFEKSGAMLGNFANTEIKQAWADEFVNALAPVKEDSVMNKVTTMMDLDRRLVERAGRGFSRVKDKASQVNDFMVMAYNMGDNVFRFAAFMTRAGDILKANKQTEMTEEVGLQAGEYAKNAFIDYDIDAKGIKMARQTVLPFVSYTYGIMPVLARIVATKPWMIANTFAVMALLDAGLAALAGDDDDELRLLGPKNMDKRIFGIGPRMHVRLPFFGDEENPVYMRWGDYVPMASSVTGGMPNNFMGQDWWPSGLAPSNPFFTMFMTMTGFDPFLGKSIFKDTNTGLQNVQEVGKQLWSLAAPPMVSSTNFKKAMELIDDKEGPTGVQPSTAMFLFGRLMGLKLVDYNLGEEEYFRQVRSSQSMRDFRAAINKARRDEYTKGYPDYEALDAEIMSLYERMLEEYNEIYKIEE